MLRGIKRDTLQTVGGTLLLFVLVIRFTDATARSFAPLLGLFGGILIYEVAEDLYDLPDGTNWMFYGLGLSFAGVYLLLNYAAWTGVLVAAGAWFIIDGATQARYGTLNSKHEYITGPENQAIPKMWAINNIHRTLQDTEQPLTPEQIADSCSLTETRARTALNYLKHRGQVTRSEQGYRAKPQKWGKATPAVQLLKWIPRRILRPMKRMRRT